MPIANDGHDEALGRHGKVGRRRLAGLPTFQRSAGSPATSLILATSDEIDQARKWMSIKRSEVGLLTADEPATAWVRTDNLMRSPKSHIQRVDALLGAVSRWRATYFKNFPSGSATCSSGTRRGTTNSGFTHEAPGGNQQGRSGSAGAMFRERETMK